MKNWESLLGRPEFKMDELFQVLEGAGLSKLDYDDFHNRFLPGNNYPQFTSDSIFALMGYLAEGAFRAERLPAYKANKSSYRIKVPSKSSSETALHHMLKQEATAWLRGNGVKRVFYEKKYLGGVADILSEDGRWAIECGASRPSKVWNALRQERSSLQKIVLFNEAGVTVFSRGPSIKAYRKMQDEWRAKMARMMGRNKWY